MRLDLNEIATHLGKHVKYIIDEPTVEDPESGLKLREAVTGEVTFSNTGNFVVARGKFHTKMELECSRCLKSYTMDVDMPIDEAFSITPPVPEMVQEDEEEELPEDAKEPLFEENVFNLTELLRQNILVAVPIKPLCEEACQGLCPQCGKDLNEGSCECPPDQETSAFAELASLLEKENEREL